MTATSFEFGTLLKAGPLLTSVTSPQPIIPQLIVLIRNKANLESIFAEQKLPTRMTSALMKKVFRYDVTGFAE